MARRELIPKTQLVNGQRIDIETGQPYTDTRAIRDLKLDAGDNGAFANLSNRTAQGVAQSASSNQQFGVAIQNLLKEYQQLGTRNFAEQELNAADQQVERIQARPDQQFIGANPNIQAGVRSAQAGALNPTISGARSGAQTFGEQIRSFGSAIESAQSFAQQQQDAADRAKSDAREIINFAVSGGSAEVQRLAEADPNLFKTAGLDPETAVAVASEAERQFSIKNTPSSGSGGGTGGGTGGTGGGLDSVSPLARQVLLNPTFLDKLTPTDRGKVLNEVANANIDISVFDTVIKAEDEQGVRTIQEGLNQVLKLWNEIPDNKKGQIQGRLQTGTGARERDKQIADFTAAQKIVGVQLTRLFEKGRLSDQDRIFYQSLMPNLNQNTYEIAEASANQLIQRLELQLQDNRQQAKNLISTGDNLTSLPSSGGEDNDPLGLR